MPDHRWQLLQRKETEIARGKRLLETNRHDSASLAKILRRPEAQWQHVAAHLPQLNTIPPEVAQQIVFDVKYEGYVQRQMQQVERHQRLAQKRIPANLDYDRLLHLRAEAKQQLAKIRPVSVDQASRISGITPADIALLRGAAATLRVPGNGRALLCGQRGSHAQRRRRPMGAPPPSRLAQPVS